MLLTILLVGAFQLTNITYSFNLLKSFPDDMSSRQGFELLEENYPAGMLAPVTIILESEQEIEMDDTFLNNSEKTTQTAVGYGKH